jgi:hypothetical protein
MTGNIFAGYFRAYEGGPLSKLTLEARIEPAQALRNPNSETVTHTPVPAGALELAISGEYRETTSRRHDIDGGGQTLDALRQVIDQDIDVRGVTRPPTSDLRRILDIWERWHLNGMRAACAHQAADGWRTRRIDPNKPADTYGLHFEGQTHASWNLLGWIRPDEHPDGLLAKPHPECGYRYGSAWLYEPLPGDVLADVRRIFFRGSGTSET